MKLNLVFVNASQTDSGKNLFDLVGKIDGSPIGGRITIPESPMATALYDFYASEDGKKSSASQTGKYAVVEIADETVLVAGTPRKFKRTGSTVVETETLDYGTVPVHQIVGKPDVAPVVKLIGKIDRPVRLDAVADQTDADIAALLG